jgi:hypothetical protein
VAVRSCASLVSIVIKKSILMIGRELAEEPELVHAWSGKLHTERLSTSSAATATKE